MSDAREPTVVLAGDVGGTNVRLALVELSGTSARLGLRSDYRVAEHGSLEEVVASFLAGLGSAPPARACLGVAGTLESERRGTGVNLPWALDADALEARCGLERVRFVNDFHAAARGVEWVGPEGLLPLGGGPARVGAPIAVLGAGTGLGQAFLVGEPGQRRVVPTEGGHRGFAPADPLQDRLLAWMRPRYGRVSTERVLSGPGLAETYRFLVEAEGRPPAASVEEVPEPEQPLAVSQAGLAGEPTPRAALELFVDVFGAEAGDVALTVLARGGVYLAGGIAPNVLRAPALQARFRRAFEQKGRLEPVVAPIPVWVVLEDALALLGAAAEA